MWYRVALAAAAMALEISGCSAGESSDRAQLSSNADAPVRADAIGINFEFQAPNFGSNGISDACLFNAAQQVDGGPFNEGQEMSLENESGTLLARGHLGPIIKYSDQDLCAMDVAFDNVLSMESNYVVVSSIGTKWRFLRAEVQTSPVTIDFLNNPGEK